MSANAFRALVSLLPGTPLLVGTVESVSGADCVITLPDGRKARAQGAAAVGDRVYFRQGGPIEGPAPNLELIVVQV